MDEVFLKREVSALCGCTGTRQDLVEALDFAARGKVGLTPALLAIKCPSAAHANAHVDGLCCTQVHCEIETHSFDDLNDIFDKLRKGQLKGRAVLGFGDAKSSAM